MNQIILACLFALAIYAGYAATEPPSASTLAVMRETQRPTTRFRDVTLHGRGDVAAETAPIAVAPKTKSIPENSIPEDVDGLSPEEAAHLAEALKEADALADRIHWKFQTLASE